MRRKLPTVLGAWHCDCSLKKCSEAALDLEECPCFRPSLFSSGNVFLTVGSWSYIGITLGCIGALNILFASTGECGSRS